MLDRTRFYKLFRPVFREITGRNLTPTQVKHLNFLLDNFESSPWFSQDIRRIAYALATIHVETFIPKSNSRYAPVTEFGGQKYFAKYDSGRLARKLGNTPETDGDGFLYRGRGFVQITGRDNYRKFGIAASPDDALDPQIAFRIMEEGMRYGKFTGRKLVDYLLNGTNYKGARRVINGQDRAAEIADYAQRFEQVLKDSADASASDIVSPNNLSSPTEAPPPPSDERSDPSETNAPPITTTLETPEGTTTVTTTSEPVTVKAVAMGIWSKIVAGIAAITGLGINFGTVIETRLSEITLNQVIILALGTALVILAVFYVKKRQEAADMKTHALIAAASDKDRHTVVLVKKL